MTETKIGSYDDAPESEVSTVLQVPLLWRQYGVLREPSGQSEDAEPARARRRAVGRSRKERTVGRHRAPHARSQSPEPVVQSPEPVVTEAISTARQTRVPQPRVAQPRVPQPRVPQRGHQRDHQREAILHTLRVGLISAALVLGLFVLGLLVLALWLP